MRQGLAGVGARMDSGAGRLGCVMSAGFACVGTSGWHYRQWSGVFYPADLPASNWLRYYAGRFRCVEVNSSFYGLPRVETVRSWTASVPHGFQFALKASRFITHRKRLKDCAASLARFLELAEGFGPHLGPILFQLPPNWHLNLGRLRDFLAMLPGGFRFAMELRDPEWQRNEVYDLLDRHGVATCRFHLAGFESPDVVTGGWTYVRLHGPGAAYCGSYSEADLGRWAERIRASQEAGRDVYLFFDNDELAYAAQDAERLRAMLGGGNLCPAP